MTDIVLKSPGNGVREYLNLLFTSPRKSIFQPSNCVKTVLDEYENGVRIVLQWCSRVHFVERVGEVMMRSKVPVEKSLPHMASLKKI